MSLVKCMLFPMSCGAGFLLVLMTEHFPPLQFSVVTAIQTALQD